MSPKEIAEKTVRTLVQEAPMYILAREALKADDELMKEGGE